MEYNSLVLLLNNLKILKIKVNNENENSQWVSKEPLLSDCSKSKIRFPHNFLFKCRPNHVNRGVDTDIICLTLKFICIRKCQLHSANTGIVWSS